MKINFILSLSLIIICLTNCSFLNKYQKAKTLNFSGLENTVKILRDEKGMAYIYAKNHYDAIMAQGFVTAQDRLFQMELTRRIASGNISEIIGEKGKAFDIKSRTIGFYRNAKKHVKILDNKTKLLFQKYLDGVNFYINNQQKHLPVEFKLTGIKPALWKVEDSLAILYYMSWNSSANIHTEIIMQMLIEKLGWNKVKEILPVNINIDDLLNEDKLSKSMSQKNMFRYLAFKNDLKSYLNKGYLELGSNNWAIAPELSSSKSPIVANDPHLNVSILPTTWYPSGIITPNFRAVGVNIPGIPGMVIGRTDKIAIGITNSYADTQDLYIETIDPQNSNRYLEGSVSLPFEILEEIIIIKDKNVSKGYRKDKIQIKLSKRGPVISEIIKDIRTQKAITLRWAPFEIMDTSIGLEDLLLAKSVRDLRKAISKLNIVMFNFVFADIKGNIGWQTSGRLPIRSQKDSILPYIVRNNKDNWIGWIPFDKMPNLYNPKKYWVGTCNNKTVKNNFPCLFLN